MRTKDTSPASIVYLEMSAVEPQQPEKPSESEAAAGTTAAATSKRKRISLKDLGRQVSCIPAHSLELRAAATPPHQTAIYMYDESPSETIRL